MYYEINEDAARVAHEMNSHSSYEMGSSTAGYRGAVDKFAALVEQRKTEVGAEHHAALDAMLDRYARDLAKWYATYASVESRCPSILVSGGGNFPVRKKEKQNAARDRLWQEYDRIKHMSERVQSIGRPKLRTEHVHNVQVSDWLFDGGKVVANTDDNRLQLLFDGKPDEETRTALKKRGFKWSPRAGAWQRQLTNNAVAAAREIVGVA